MKAQGYFTRQKWFWITALLLIILLRILSRFPWLIEKYYRRGFYQQVSRVLRFLFGWLPISFGDVLYFVGGCWLLYVFTTFVLVLFRRRLKSGLMLEKLLRLLKVAISLYLIFNIFWGLNYDSVSASRELKLGPQAYDSSALIAIQKILLEKVNANKKFLIQQQAQYPSNKEIFLRADKCYSSAAQLYPFMKYRQRSLKSSLYGSLGNYLGFTGYYNPFTGEAQVNTTVPAFLVPYIAAHEIGHQLGYAKEDEANFIGYLASANSEDTLFKYSTYLELFLFANQEVFFLDSGLAKKSMKSLSSPVMQDIEEWRRFNLAHRSFLEPAITWMYGKYLELNKQPAGLRSYSQVIATLIAYYKKFGRI